MEIFFKSPFLLYVLLFPLMFLLCAPLPTQANPHLTFFLESYEVGYSTSKKFNLVEGVQPQPPFS